MPIFLKWNRQENWPLDGTHLLAEAGDAGFQPDNLTEFWDSAVKSYKVDWSTNYLETNFQMGQGGARVLAGRGDCQDSLSGTQLVDLYGKGFLVFHNVYTLIFRKKF